MHYNPSFDGAQTHVGAGFRSSHHARLTPGIPMNENSCVCGRTIIYWLFGIWRGKATYSMHQLGEEAIALKVEIKTLEKSCDLENAITTPLDRFDLIVQTFHETTVETLHKVVDDFIQPVVKRR